MTAICAIPNCGKRAPADEPFCRSHEGRVQTPTERDAAIKANARKLHSTLVALCAQIIRSTCSAPSEMTMIEIDREFTRMRNAAIDASLVISHIDRT